MMKKWKCASIWPSHTWTSTAEAVSRPVADIAERSLRPPRNCRASSANPTRGAASSSACHTGKPRSRLKTRMPAALTHSSATIQR